MNFLFVNGASGAGKTTTAHGIARLVPRIAWLHPDGLWDDTPHLTAQVTFDRIDNWVRILLSEATVAGDAVLDTQLHCASEIATLVLHHNPN